MQKTLRALLPALAALTGASSCSEDFDVMAPARPITVVYAVLDPADTAHYVRIQRGFGSSTQSALDLARLPDSSYFTNLTVTLQENSGGGYNTVQDNLPRVRLSDEGYAKESGDFFSAPSYAYKFRYPLVQGRSYRLLIKNNDNGNTDTAETVIPNLQNALIAELRPDYTPLLQLKLTPTYPNDESRDGNYTWTVLNYPTSYTARMMDAVLRFHFVEKDAQGRETRRRLDYTFARTFRNSDSVTGWNATRPFQKFNTIYANIGRLLGPAPAGVDRYIDRPDLLAYFGTPELYRWEQNQLTTGGLAGDQVQYRYTNLRGRDVIGLFAARVRLERLAAPIEAATVQELRTNAHTASARIVDTVAR